MGLDITSYRQLKTAPEAKLNEDGSPVEWGRFLWVHASVLEWTEKNWPGQADTLTPGIYSYAASDGFRAGSYGGYGAWRRWLASRAGYESIEALWENPKPGPFVELLNFADNEGYIGSIVAAKLAKDFAEHRERICAGEDTWETNLYAKWQEAFEMAADGGCVEFH